MRKAFMGAIILLFSYGFTCSPSTKHTEQVEPLIQPVIIQINEAEKNDETITLVEEKPEISRDEMIRDIVHVWDIFFDDYNVNQGDPRRTYFEEYASYIADAVITYQNTPVIINGDSAMLPKHRSTHIMMAVIITKESSVDHTVVGAEPRFEVGLMQVWGVALNGYNKETVKNNAKLGVTLGVRWITFMLSQCKMHRMRGDEEGWRNTDWLRPLTMYGAKPSSVWKNRKEKTCRIFPHAKERVTLAQMYTERIDGERQIELQL